MRAVGQRLALPLALAVLLAGSGCGQRDVRANSLEDSYVKLAAWIGAPEICEKIHPSARSAAGGNPPGVQVWYERSRCFLDVALRVGDPELCEEVRPALHLLLDGSEYSERACRRAAESTKRFYPNSPDVELFVPLLGYRAPADAAAADHFQAQWDLFVGNAHDRDFLRRAQQLPDFRSGDERAARVAWSLVPECAEDPTAHPICHRLECALIRDQLSAIECRRAADDPPGQAQLTSS